MSQRMASKGKCKFCSELFSGSTIVRHLTSCGLRKLSLEKEIDNLNSKKPTRKNSKIFGLKAWASYNPSYWLCLEANGDHLLSNIDQFLRDLWLECCGHLSAFTINKERYESGGEMGFDSDESEHGMGIALSKVLSPELEFHYEYDYGSTTDLDLKVVWEREGNLKKKEVSILARNETVVFKCVSCGETAEVICAECDCEKESSYCRKCGAKHECGEDMLLPVVNSPRMGVCGYVGAEV